MGNPEFAGRIQFEAAVGGGIPCIKALKEGLAANEIGNIAGAFFGGPVQILQEASSFKGSYVLSIFFVFLFLF